MALPEIQPLLNGLRMARSRFLFGIERVPDDRLTFNPGGAAKSPLELAGKLAGFLSFITLMTQGQMPDRSGGAPPPPATREEAMAALEGAFEGLRSMLEGLTAADLDRMIQMPWGTQMSQRQWLYGIPAVIGYFQGQLNYVQLIYGDEDPNMPPDWMSGQS
jgi:hypothetical protein